MPAPIRPMPANPTSAGPQTEPEGRRARRNPIAKASASKPVIIKSGNLHPTGVAKGERAGRISQGIIVDARGALHDPRASEQWTGDYAAYKECLCYPGDRAQDVLFCARLSFPGCQVSNDEYLSGFLSLTANPNLPPNERKLSHRWRGRALLRSTTVSSL